jgi:hypothetical protein
MGLVVAVMDAAEAFLRARSEHVPPPGIYNLFEELWLS